MDSIEKYTQMSFYPTDKELEIVQITAEKATNSPESEFGAAYGGQMGATVSPGDLLINDKGNNFALIHELIHCIQYRNYNSMGSICDEGYATYITEQILSNTTSPYFLDSHFNYSSTIDINKTNVTKLFTNSEIGWDGYLIGFRFMHYLEEEIGSGTYLKILDNAYAGQTDMQLTLKEVNAAIKKVVSKSVFTNFVTWNSKNKESFYKENTLYDYTECKKLNLFPSFAYFSSYETLRFTYNKAFTIDFTNGFEYLQAYKHYKVKGFMGKVGSIGSAKFKFYDIKGKLLMSKSIKNSSETIKVWGAVKLVITGDGKQVTVEPDIKEMIKK